MQQQQQKKKKTRTTNNAVINQKLGQDSLIKSIEGNPSVQMNIKIIKLRQTVFLNCFEPILIMG